MRIVVSPDMVAHLWANQSQATARNSGHTFYFHHDTIYSYGSHFPIARHVTHKGKKAILFTTRGYSSTTSQHKVAVRNAIKWDATVFHVSDVCGGHAANMKHFASMVADQEAKAAKAMKHKVAEYKKSACNYAKEGNEYAKFFGLKTRLKSKAPTEAELTAATEYAAKREEARTRKAREAEAKRDTEYTEAIGKWLAGGPVHLPYMHFKPTMLRIKDDMIQTSRGAEVPVDHAVKILPFVRAGKAWHRNGQQIRIGAFFMDSIDEQGNIKVGCHTIERGEIERIAAILKV